MEAASCGNEAVSQYGPGRAAVTRAGSQTDGRIQRSTRSRESLVSALLSLVEEGHLQPTGQQVADRAGMNLRTVFRHFDDMESLHGAVHEQLVRTLRPELEEAPATGSVRERLGAFVKRRARMFERIGPFERAGRLHRWSSSRLQSVHREFIAQLASDLVLWLPEVASLPAPLRASAELLSSFEAWARLRDEQDLSVRQARAALEAGLARVLDV
jgi:AcrR family transcriptional regulator